MTVVTTEYELTWAHKALTFVMPEAEMARIVEGWRRRGAVTGDLADGHVSFKSDFGQRAEVKRRDRGRTGR